MLVEGFGGGLPAEGLAGSAVERCGDRVKFRRAVSAQVGALGEVLAEQAVGVFVRAALLGAVRVAEVDGQPGVDAEPACWAISAPWSQANDLRSWSGKLVIVVAMASRTASAPWPANGGPLLARGWVPWPGMGGRCSSRVNRVERSTKVPMADRFVPKIRSPSQWPGTARSSASAGRSLIITFGLMNRLPRPRVLARGTRSARPVRRQAVSSRRSPPRPCT